MRGSTPPEYLPLIQLLRARYGDPAAPDLAQLQQRLRATGTDGGDPDVRSGCVTIVLDEPTGLRLEYTWEDGVLTGLALLRMPLPIGAYPVAEPEATPAAQRAATSLRTPSLIGRGWRPQHRACRRSGGQRFRPMACAHE